MTYCQKASRRQQYPPPAISRSTEARCKQDSRPVRGQCPIEYGREFSSIHSSVCLSIHPSIHSKDGLNQPLGSLSQLLDILSQPLGDLSQTEPASTLPDLASVQADPALADLWVYTEMYRWNFSLVSYMTSSPIRSAAQKELLSRSKSKLRLTHGIILAIGLMNAYDLLEQGDFMSNGIFKKSIKATGCY